MAEKKIKKVIKTKTKTEKKVKDNLKNKNTLLVILLSIMVILFLAIEIYVVVKKQISMSKKPVFIGEWRPQYKGQIGMPVWRDHLYVIDNNSNIITKYDKMNGTVIDAYPVEKTPKWVVETSTGDTIILLYDSDELLKYTGNKLTGKISIKEVREPVGMVIDSQDNIYLSDNSSLKIYKYDINGEKILEFGGRDKIRRAGRIFIDKNDNIYLIDTMQPYYIKVFTADGKLIRKFELKLKKLSGLEALAITHDGNIYINDVAESKIIVFSPNGKLLGNFDTDIDYKYKIGVPGAFSGGLDNNLYVGSYSLAIFEAIKY